ncbi:MAG: nucleoside recognition domain-containing protein [Massilibacteroides sp.]|nr:nucleoside recognition domain-containing protein [Massilibacteroides sp.]MDD3061282.1 nucleoside recognition domain-containing protein [Massilibacteroides sp.]MDD4114630.1 nucleoside recognition domain-containing protein [Massilibacteroides sp.]MDD4659779.1 nucleoside recognition domain-containing protein [Massilibacteroides sp.]
MDKVIQRVWSCVKKALPKAGKTCVWLFKIILPVSLLVRLLQYSGVLDSIASFFYPVFSLVGLPGETAIVFITSLFTPLYAPVALITSMSLGLRGATILALMCLLSHNLIVESSIQAKTGSSFWGITSLRIFMSFVIAFTLNLVMPIDGWGQVLTTESAEICNSLPEVFQLWFFSSVRIVLTIAIIVTALMLLHYVLVEFNWLTRISVCLLPLMSIFGLPKDTAFSWLVGNLVGLAYGGGIMVEQIEENKLTRESGKLLNIHLAISHSLLEDTLIFVAIGIPVLWIVVTRLLFAIAAVWLHRGYNYLKMRNLNHSYG